MENKATEDTVLPCSSNVATAMLRCQHNFSWNIYEKGSERSNPKQRCEISFSIIKSALSQIKDHIRETDCAKVSLDLEDESFEFFVKEEISQFMSSVKTRGVIYTLLQLSEKQKSKGVIAISTGSFAVILCYYGRKFNIPVTVVMPTSVADKYVDICQNLISASDEEVEHPECVSTNVAVTVLVQGSDMIEAHNIALRIAKEKGLFYLDGDDHPNMIIGQATLGIEIMEQLSTIDTIILPTRTDDCGVTAAIAMIIKKYDPNIHVIEAQMESLDPLIENIRSQTHFYHELETNDPADKLWYAMNRGNRSIPRCWIDSIVRLDEMLINDAANLLLKEKKNIEFEQFIAIGLAAIRNSQISQTYNYKGKRIVICRFGKIDSSKELTTSEPYEDLRWLFA